MNHAYRVPPRSGSSTSSPTMAKSRSTTRAAAPRREAANRSSAVLVLKGLLREDTSDNGSWDGSDEHNLPPASDDHKVGRVPVGNNPRPGAIRIHRIRARDVDGHDDAVAAVGEMLGKVPFSVEGDNPDVSDRSHCDESPGGNESIGALQATKCACVIFVCSCIGHGAAEDQGHSDDGHGPYDRWSDAHTSSPFVIEWCSLRGRPNAIMIKSGFLVSTSARIGPTVRLAISIRVRLPAVNVATMLGVVNESNPANLSKETFVSPRLTG